MSEAVARRNSEKVERPEGESAGVDLSIAKAQLGDLVVRAGLTHERIALVRYGKIAAYVIGPKDYLRLRELDERDSKR